MFACASEKPFASLPRAVSQRNNYSSGRNEDYDQSPTYNMNPLLVRTIRTSPFFRESLSTVRSWDEFLDYVAAMSDDVLASEGCMPWLYSHKATRVNQSASLRGVASDSGAPSTLFCLVLRGFALMSGLEQMKALIANRDSPVPRVLALLMLRFACPPGELLSWFKRSFADETPITPMGRRGPPSTLGWLARALLRSRSWGGTLLPRLPIAVEKDVREALSEYDDDEDLEGDGRRDRHQDRQDDRYNDRYRDRRYDRHDDRYRDDRYRDRDDRQDDRYRDRDYRPDDRYRGRDDRPDNRYHGRDDRPDDRYRDEAHGRYGRAGGDRRWAHGRGRGYGARDGDEDGGRRGWGGPRGGRGRPPYDRRGEAGEDGQWRPRGQDDKARHDAGDRRERGGDGDGEPGENRQGATEKPAPALPTPQPAERKAARRVAELRALIGEQSGVQGPGAVGGDYAAPARPR